VSAGILRTSRIWAPKQSHRGLPAAPRASRALPSSRFWGAPARSATGSISNASEHCLSHPAPETRRAHRVFSRSPPAVGTARQAMARRAARQTDDPPSRVTREVIHTAPAVRTACKHIAARPHPTANTGPKPFYFSREDSQRRFGTKTTERPFPLSSYSSLLRLLSSSQLTSHPAALQGP